MTCGNNYAEIKNSYAAYQTSFPIILQSIRNIHLYTCIYVKIEASMSVFKAGDLKKITTCC